MSNLYLERCHEREDGNQRFAYMKVNSSPIIQTGLYHNTRILCVQSVCATHHDLSTIAGCKMTSH